TAVRALGGEPEPGHPVGAAAHRAAPADQTLSRRLQLPVPAGWGAARAAWAPSLPIRTPSLMPRSWGWIWAVVETTRPGMWLDTGGIRVGGPKVTSGAA